MEIVSTRSYPGGYEDIFTAVCCIGNPVGTDDVYVAMYDVSISNDGVTYSNEKTVYVYDSTCQEIEVQNNGSRLFTLKVKLCIVKLRVYVLYCFLIELTNHYRFVFIIYFQILPRHCRPVARYYVAKRSRTPDVARTFDLPRQPVNWHGLLLSAEYVDA